MTREYVYDSAGAALRRYFALAEQMGVCGSHPIHPDEVIKGTRTSTDNARLLELLDLALCLRGLTRLQHAILVTEFCASDAPIEGTASWSKHRGKYSRRMPKLALIKGLVGVGLTNADAYDYHLGCAMRCVRRELETRGWIELTTFARTH